jgi:ketosteroid isomerase-like protein
VSNYPWREMLADVTRDDFQPIDLTWRDTAAYRKIGGNWLIAHEHGSVPVYLATGKPDLASKP